MKNINIVVLNVVVCIISFRFAWVVKKYLNENVPGHVQQFSLELLIMYMFVFLFNFGFQFAFRAEEVFEIRSLRRKGLSITDFYTSPAKVIIGGCVFFVMSFVFLFSFFILSGHFVEIPWKMEDPNFEVTFLSWALVLFSGYIGYRISKSAVW